MENFIIQMMDSYGYIGIGLLIFIENLFPPIPSEVILTFGGFMTANSKITILGVILSSTAGSVTGAVVLYYIGKILNKERLIKIVQSKYVRWLRIKPKDIESADRWFSSKGNKAVFFCRFIPVVRSLISIPAGMSEMSIVKFLLYTTFGSAIWNSALVYVGAFAGDKKDIILELLNDVSHIIIIAIVLILVFCFYKFYKARFKKNKP